MTGEEILALIQGGEGYHTEFKEGTQRPGTGLRRGRGGFLGDAV
jgi:hypothetical protein